MSMQIAGILRAFDYLLANISLAPPERAIIESHLNDARDTTAKVVEGVGQIAENIVTEKLVTYTGDFSDELVPIAKAVIDHAEDKVEDAVRWVLGIKFSKKLVGAKSGAGQKVKELLAASDNKVEVATAALFQAKGYGNVNVQNK